MRSASALAVLLTAFSFPAVVAAQAGASAGTLRPLAIEDHCRVAEVGSPRISPDGRWVTYTVATPVEETNGDDVATWIARADGSATPTRVTHQGRNDTDPAWTAEGRLVYVAPDSARWTVDPQGPTGPATSAEEEAEGALSPDGQWRAVVRELPANARRSPARTPFETRHEERFEGVQLDWYPFVRDGREFPTPDPRYEAAAEIFLEPAA